MNISMHRQIPKNPPRMQFIGSPYSDREIKTFAEALLAVERINGVYEPRFEAARTAEEELLVRQAALKEVTTLLEQKGTSLGKYREILVVAQNDPEIALGISAEITKIL